MKEDELINWQSYYPLCPYCEQEILKVNVYITPLEAPISIPGSFYITKRKNCILTSCPHCRKVIGVYDYWVGK